MMKRTIQTAVAAAFFGSAFVAHAATTLVQNGYVHGGPSNVTVAGAPSNNGNHNAGEFTGVFNGTSFQSYCSDLLQTFSFGTVYTAAYSAQTGSAAYGATKATQIGQLLTAGGGFAASVTSSQSTALQAGIWEILYETTTTTPFNLGTGNFTAAPGSVLVADLTTVNGYLANLNTFAVTPFTALVSEKHQDFITAVPEPETYALMLAGLASIGFVARRRASKA